MDVDDFVQWWSTRRRRDLEGLIDAVASSTDTADGEVERLRASREVARLLQRTGRRRTACEASHRVSLGVLELCEITGVRAEDPDGATLLARAAGDAARALVASPDSPCCETLLRPFVSVPHLHVA